MKYIGTFREGMHVSDVYLCKTKQIALTKAGKEYGSLILQDKTGVVDAKIWDLGSPGVGNFEALDYVYVDADGETDPPGGGCGVHTGGLPAGFRKEHRRDV